MESGKPTLESILEFLKNQRGFDFSAYRVSMIERRIQKRIFSTKTDSIDKYLDYLYHQPEELDHLIDAFTINVSRFFRNSLSFEYIRKIIIPDILVDKIKLNDQSFRIWSAGCSYGEEVYSMAIILNEYMEKEGGLIKPTIFATDIDKKALLKASEGSYNSNSIRSIKYGLVEKYFTKEADRFTIDPKLRQMIQFSFYNLLDQNSIVPSDSIYGAFDMVFCRNVLIYMEMGSHHFIFNKLYKSLKPNGILVLGEAEIPTESFKHKFKRESKCCKIYRKIG